MGGSSLLYPQPLLLHSTTNPVFAPKGRGSLVIRAVDGNRDHSKHSHSQSSKEEIIALFKRIQSSISKGDAAANNTSAESMLEVLHQSRTQQRGKGKSIGTKTGKKLFGQKKNPPKKEEEEDEGSLGIKSTRPPSKFTRRSPIPSVSRSPRDETERLSESTTDDVRDDVGKQSNEFGEMKLAQLRQVAKLKGIKGYSKLKKGELLELLLSSLKTTSP